MSDDKPDPIEDVRKGLGLLFRAAKSTIEKLPTKDFEEAITTGAREVGRAIENVTSTIEREVFHTKGTKPGEEARPDERVRVDVAADQPGTDKPATDRSGSGDPPAGV